MSWRMVVVTGRCKLEYKMGYLVCRGEQTHKIFIGEISSLVVESTAVSVTTALLCELIRNKVNVVFCDEYHNPQSQLLSLYDRHDCSGMLKRQLAWSENAKVDVWTEIVRMKISKQMQFLKEMDCERWVMLQDYLDHMEDGDLSNREGLAAKVYFDSLFGLRFRRGDDTFTNAALNYGYSVLLSAVNRVIVGCGYNTEIALCHRNEFNCFNLGCDLMEPFRVVVDRAVFCSEEQENLTSNYKHYLCDILNRELKIDGKRFAMIDVLAIYLQSVFAALESEDISLLKEYEF